jgi:hypothetical protein
VWSLPKKKPRRQPDTILAAETVASPGPRPLAPGPRPQPQSQLERRSLLLAAGLIALAAVRIVSTYSVFGNTGDEPAHLACGLQYLAQHVYRYETQHPPLARAMAALGPYLDGARPMGMANMEQEGVALIYGSGHPDRFLFLMRLGILPFFLLAGLVVYWWTRRLFGGATAVIAAGLFTLIPPVLAHATFATTDMPLTACLGAAFVTLLWWAQAPSGKRSLLLGLTCALAALAKFTSLGYLPAAALLSLAAYVAVERPGMKSLAGFGLAVLTGAVLVWAAYFFSFGKVPAWNITLPAPEFFDGIASAMRHNRIGNPAYLLGQVGTRGWWYFFPVALAVKTPVALLVLVGLGVAICWRRRDGWTRLTPMAFGLGILLPAMTSHVNIGLRHILPIYLSFSILGAVAVVRLIEWGDARRAKAKPWGSVVAAGLVLWLFASGAAHHPDYLSYFNEFAGRHPDNILVDSDYDWGQDQKRLAKRLRELEARQVGFGWLGDNQSLWPELPATRKIDPLQPAEGWTAVSPTLDKVRQYGLEHRYPNLQPWFDYLQPKETVGTLRLYFVAPGSLRPQP